MKNSKRMFILSEVVLALMVIAVAIIMLKEKNGQELVQVSVILQDSEDSQWSALKYGLKKAAEDFGLDLFIVSTEDRMGIEEQESLIEKEIEEGADAIIVQPVPGNESEERLKKLQKKVPLMLVEFAASKEGGDSQLPVTRPDHYGMGKSLGEELLKDYSDNLQEKTIGIVAENGDSQAVNDREKGFLDAIEGKGGKILWKKMDDFENSRGMSLPDQPKVDFVIALDDKSFVEAGKDVTSNNLHGALLYGIGNSTESVYYLDFGSAECLVVPDEFNVGYQSAGEVAARMESVFYQMEDRTVTYQVIRQENLFTKENQEILFTMNQ